MIFVKNIIIQGYLGHYYSIFDRFPQNIFIVQYSFSKLCFKRISLDNQQYSATQQPIFIILHRQSMGCDQTSGVLKPIKAGSSKNELRVASLNYCGIMNSPYEFYVQQKYKELKQISDIFVQITKREVRDFKEGFKWKGSSIDHEFRKERYSPMFDMMIGIQKSRFLTRKEYQDKWKEVFDLKCPKKFKEKPQEDIDHLKMYDIVMYNTLLKWVYNIETIDQAQDKDPDQYLTKLRPLFELSFLNESRKLKKLTQNLQRMQADVFIFQQYSKKLYDHVQGLGTYHIATDAPGQKGDTLILARKKKFQNKKPMQLDQALSNMSEDVKKDLQMSQKTAYMVIDNYIIISLHLSSKTEINKDQVAKLQGALVRLQKAYPNMHIIAAGDVNSYFGPSPAFSGPGLFNMFPQKESQLTTVKKRTYTQAQFHKAGKLVEESKDKIMTTLPIKQGQILYINGQVPKRGTQNEGYIPSDGHPFDHFVCLAKLIIP